MCDKIEYCPYCNVPYGIAKECDCQLEPIKKYSIDECIENCKEFAGEVGLSDYNESVLFHLQKYKKLLEENIQNILKVKQIEQLVTKLDKKLDNALKCQK